VISSNKIGLNLVTTPGSTYFHLITAPLLRDVNRKPQSRQAPLPVQGCTVSLERTHKAAGPIMMTGGAGVFYVGPCAASERGTPSNSFLGYFGVWGWHLSTVFSQHFLYLIDIMLTW